MKDLGQQFVTMGGTIDRDMERWIEGGCVGPQPRKEVKTISALSFPVGPTERIDLDDDGVDDVAIQPVEMFRLERMSKSSFWACTYAPDGSGRHVFWFYAKKGKLTVEHRWEPLS